MEEKRIVRTVVGSASRLHEARSQVATNVNMAPLKEHISGIARPKSPVSSLKKAGVALNVAEPHPVTDIAGAALIATSYAMKGKEPAKLDDIAMETRKILRDIQSLRL